MCGVFANNKCLCSADILQNLRGPLPAVRPRADLPQPHRLLRHPAAQPRPAPSQTQVTHNTPNIFWAAKYFVQGHIRGGVRGQAAAGGHPVYGQHPDRADPAVPRLGAVKYSTVQYSTVRYSTVQYSCAPLPVQSQHSDASKDLIICIYLLSINLIHGTL